MSLPDLAALVSEVAPEELPALAGRLREAELLAELRMRQDALVDSKRQDAAETWLTPAAAAAVASVPVKRIYEWARGKRWASRPTQRCLRIEEAEFRRWLGVR